MKGVYTLGYKHAKHNYPQCEGSYGLDLDDRYAARNQMYLQYVGAGEEIEAAEGEGEGDEEGSLLGSCWVHGAGLVPNRSRMKYPHTMLSTHPFTVNFV